MSDERNPYLQKSQKPILKPSVVAFIDILGYKNTVLDADEEGNSLRLLSKLHKTLKSAVGYMRDPLGEANEIFKSPILERDLYKVVTFTDNIVIGYPIKGDAEAELGHIFSHLSQYQLTLSKAGFFIRGAIAIGEVYIDDYVVFGKGFLDAHNAETTKARDPRIILTDSVRKTIRKHLKYYGNPAYAPQVRDLYRDADGQFFLNYLEATMIAKDELGPDYDSISAHKLAVEGKLKQHTNHPPFWSKYAWTANYHNFFCDQYLSIDKDYRIDLNKFQMKPTLIIE
jgi:hypothetical protein